MFLLAAIVACFIYLAFFSEAARSESTGFWGTVAPLLVMLGFVPVAYSTINTRYRLFPDCLEMRSGFFRGTLYLRDILEIEPVGFIREQKTVTIKGRSYCNRQFNGLKIKTHDDRTIYITPSNPESFLSRLQQRMKTRTAT